jgi:hypothetical protein
MILKLRSRHSRQSVSFPSKTHGGRNDTAFLRAIAVILIVNSHLDNFYPVPMLATGGTIGNSIFFMLSAMGLYLSWQRTRRNLGEWYGRRITKIYPSVWIVIIFLVLPQDIISGAIKGDNFLEKMGMFFFPPFWFIQALLLFYFALFFILKFFSNRLLIGVAVPLILLYAICYISCIDLESYSIWKLPFTLIFYSLVFLWGIYLGSIRERVCFHSVWDIFGLVLCIVCIYGDKYMMYRGHVLYLQFVQDLAIFPMLLFLLKVARSRFILDKVMQKGVVSRVANLLSEMTLEIYICHTALRVVFEHFRIGFPANAIAFIIASVGAALLIFNGSGVVRQYLRNRDISI